MRIFVAVIPPAAVQAAAFSVIETLRRTGDGVSWVKLENLHYTMRFLGEIGEDGLGRVTEAATAAAAATPAFDAELGGPGAFPNARRARVIWLGMRAGAETLAALAKSLERALATRGFEPEGRPFTAHLTLGRVREPRADWSAPLESARIAEGAPRRFRVDRLTVVESRLNPKGSIYTPRAESALAG
jgi:2'-5' RNA ligase